MSHRNHGIAKAFLVDAGFAANAQIGDLVRVANNGKITDQAGEGNKLFLPLVEDVSIVGVDIPTKAAGVTVSGVAKVKVTTATGITAGSKLAVSGKGVILWTTGFSLGQALETPKGNGDYIAVLLAPVL